MNRIFIISMLFVSIYVGFFSNKSIADDISYFHVQQQIYENGEEFNKLWIAFEVGFLKENLINLSINDRTVPISQIEFTSSTYHFASYDEVAGFTIAGEQSKRGYSANIDEPLIPGGLYHLEVVDNSGNEFSGQFTFSDDLPLPVIPSSTFQYYFNEQGDLVWSWKVPTGLNPESVSLEASVLGQNEVDLDTISYVIEVPLNLERLVIPKDILDLEDLEAQGYKFRLRVALITNDHSERSYSKRVKMHCFFDAEVIIPCSVGQESIGLKAVTGTIVEVSPLDPATITDNFNRPENLDLGLISLKITDVDPATHKGKVKVYLPFAAHERVRWFKYNTRRGWWDYSQHAEFNDARDEVTLIFVDGGKGDDDGLVNGEIVDPSGPGTASTASNSDGGSGGGGGGGCFIATAAKGSEIDKN